MASATPGTHSYFSDPIESDSSETYNYDTDTDTPLPFPLPLNRTAFLNPSFSASSFLSTLQNRFQTLEDLQSELQDLLRSLNRELVDLVNDNYTEFLSLGEKLRGGEERIEEVRVGLLGFRGDVGGVRDLVSERGDEVRGLLGEKRGLRRDGAVGRGLLEVDERLEELEGRLGIAQHGVEKLSKNDAPEDDTQIGDFKDWDESWTADDMDELDLMPSDYEEEDEKTQQDSDIPRRLRRNLEQLQIIQVLSKRCGEQHPFILAQRDRISQIKDVLRRDLESAIRAQGDVKVKQRIIRMRSGLDEE
ncbi:hypothetical protein PMZ80_006440 [Knufia obscura]|uniref:Conserved oligomeric Golgi complex subunit 2 n=2 Tax=Knufia TaxID=430999 RepID=A0AAN8F8Q9_9EURO|nr:hypothetical protein PMZ80_006440 [Knufia obscura]KAK5953411.1 hypothetical protein OHC33_005355 [Knufia fluminis]